MVEQRFAGAMVVVGVMLWPVAVWAQAPAPPPTHEGSIEAAFSGVSGNATSSTFGLGAEVITRPHTWMLRQRLSFLRNESTGAVTSQALLYSPRAERTLSPRAGAFVEYAYFRDRFAGVANRNSATGSVSLKVVTQARQTLALDMGIGYLSETRLVGKNISSGIYTVGAAYRVKLSATADVSDDANMLRDVSHAIDWRLVHVVALSARLNGSLSLKVSSTVRYTHSPAPGFKTTDTITSVALVAKFKGKH